MSRIACLLCSAFVFMRGENLFLNGAEPVVIEPPRSYEQHASPFDVGNRVQLFIDKTLIHRTDRVWFTQHSGKKHPDNPLVVADQTWEGWRLEIFGNVLFDEQEQIFKMWYLCEGVGKFAGQGVTCYATSRDGIRWEKPLVGTLDDGSGQPNNIVLFGHHAGVVKDVADPDPARRYKTTCSRPDPRYPSYSYWAMVSPDGFRWTPAADQPIAPGYDVVNSHWDPFRKVWIAFAKNHELPWRGQVRRVFDLTISPDFQNWSKPVPAFYPDLRDDLGSMARIEAARSLLDRPDNPALVRTEFYGVGAYPHESCTIAFPWIFTVNNDARYGNQEGPMEIQLAVSRDLREWERPFRTPIIEFSPPGGWDSGSHVTESLAIRVGDEIRLYYGGANYTHGTPVLYTPTFPENGKLTGRKDPYTGSVGLVTWQLDRFVSVEGPSHGGTLTTVPLKFSGKRLEINARTKNAGSLLVEILDAADHPIPEIGLSVPFQGDSLRETVSFEGNPDLSMLQGRAIKLQFRLTDAELFSFAFRD